MSADTGVYVNENGELVTVAGLTVPAPLVEIEREVALPPNLLPLTVTAAVPQVSPDVEERLIEGALTHPQATLKSLPVVVQLPFLTVMLCVPLLTPGNWVEL